MAGFAKSYLSLSQAQNEGQGGQATGNGFFLIFFKVFKIILYWSTAI